MYAKIQTTNQAVFEVIGGCYAHDNKFEIKVISNDEEIGYCETLYSNYW